MKCEEPKKAHRSNLLGSIVLNLLLIVAISGCHPSTAAAPPDSEPTTAALPTSTLASGLNTSLNSPKDNMVMVFVPAGQFVMGSEKGLTDEQPAHTVTLDGYWMDQTEVTNAMYSICVEAGTCEEPSSTVDYNDPSFANHPVIFVSWEDARTYCAWADRRLPTEAEWEKAASWDPVTQQKRVYPWGNDLDCKMGNFDDETQLDSFVIEGGPNCDGYARTAPVGSFPSGISPYGVLDMGGNVWEWVHDAFLETDPLNASIQNYYAVSPAVNPQGVDTSLTEYRVMRGGSWNINFGLGRTAYRLWFGLDDSYDFTGFRCAKS